MDRRKLIFVFAIIVLFFSVMVAGGPLPVLGQSTSANTVYFPLIFNPPEPPVWIGPDGGNIIAVAVAPSQPSTLYAGTWGSGIYKSIDSGATWTCKSNGLGLMYIQSMAVDPRNPQVAYAGTYKGKIYKTLDGGESWFQSSTNIQDQAIVYSIVIDPLDNENIFIGTRGLSNNGGPPWNGVLYRSTNAGNTWEPKLTDVGGKYQQDWAYSVTLHPRFPHLVYAATHEHGIYRSLDFGKNWEAVNAGITNFTTRAIVVNPNSTEAYPILYTGVWTYGGIFRSNDGGESWFAVGNGSIDTRIYTMSINPKESYIVYASTFSGGVLKTINGGNSWEIVGLKDYEIPMTAIDPQTPQILYTGTNGNGLFKSLDAGKNWGRSQQGLHATRVSAVQVLPTDSQRLYAGLARDGVRQTGNGGQTWDLLGSNLGDPKVLGLVMPPDRPQVLFALTETAGLYRCDQQSGGICWQKISISFPLTAQAIFDVGHPLFMPPLLDDDFSTPDAVTATPALLALSFAPSNPQIAYLGTSGAGVYQSLNGGGSWNASGLSGSKIVALAVDSGNPNRVFAASDTRVWSSDNGGASWDDTNLAGVTVYALALDGAGILYAGTSNGIYQRSLAGWAHLGLAGLPISALAPHPNKVGWLYAGTSDGLRLSRNAGQTWNVGPLALSGLAVSAIHFDPADPSWLYLSTATQGVLRMQDWK